MSTHSPRKYYTPSRGRGQAARGTTTVTSATPDRNITEGLAPEPLQIIARPPLAPTDTSVKVSNLQYVGSYNWTSNPSPTIIVPGSPPEWQDRPMPYQVQPDRGAVFVDQNGFRMPTAVLLPLIAAVNRKADDDHKSPFEWSSMDFITDRNGLRKLLRWITAGATTVIKDFRIDTQLAGTGTVLFNRWEKRTQEEASGYTYGFNYEKASTKPAEGCSGSTGYHRIVQYDLNGLKMVVRFEVDACIPTSSARSKSLSVDDSLADAIAGLKLSTTSSADATKSSSKTPALAILKGGSDVPQASLVELTTRSEARQADYDWVDSYPQLFLSQTSHHFLAVHQRGRFSSVQKRTLNSTELRAIERNIQPALRKLRRLLDVIKALVIKHGERGRLSLVCTAGELKVYERTGQASCLPDECMELFNV